MRSERKNFVVYMSHPVLGTMITAPMTIDRARTQAKKENIKWVKEWLEESGPRPQIHILEIVETVDEKVKDVYRF